jgi:FkbM family methyltransferase
MIDVGACRGAALRVFAEQDWTIHAFEPSTALSNYLREKYKSPKIHIINDAVSDVEKDHVPFYTSKESVGIGSLKAFLPSHELSEQVRTTKLNSYFKAKHINKIDFLKIDTEGYDLMVLKGLDLNRYPVEVILCEFEDLKSKPIGYDFHNLALYLESFNYTIYMSEWHPIVKYGITHQWRILKRYPCELEDTKAWGNLIAFSNDPGIFSITRAIKKSISKFEKKIGIDPTNIPLNGESSTSERLDYALQLLSASRKRNQFLENQLSSVYASTSWKITAPFRSVVETIRHITQYLNKKGRKLF